MPMSPKAKSSLLNISAFIGAVVAIAGLIAPAARAVDSRYVHIDTFKVIQQMKATDDTLKAVRHEQEIREIKSTLARVDSNARCARRRKPAWCE